MTAKIRLLSILALAQLACVIATVPSNTATAVITTVAPTLTASMTAEPTLTLTAVTATAVKPSKTPEATVTPAVICTVKTGVPNGWLNVRWGPGMEYDAFAAVKEGQSLKVADIVDGDWIPVNLPDGRAGYVWRALCAQEVR